MAMIDLSHLINLPANDALRINRMLELFPVMGAPKPFSLDELVFTPKNESYFDVFVEGILKKGNPNGQTELGEEDVLEDIVGGNPEDAYELGRQHAVNKISKDVAEFLKRDSKSGRKELLNQIRSAGNAHGCVRLGMGDYLAFATQEVLRSYILGGEHTRNELAHKATNVQWAINDPSVKKSFL